MKHRQFLTSALIMIALLVGGSAAVWADRDHRQGQDRYQDKNHHKKGYVYDRRYHYNRSYPPPGYKSKSISHYHYVVPYRGHKYYYDRGVWYLPSGPSFVVVAPPLGIVVRTLPPYYSTIWVGGIPYYYSAGVYYTWRPEQQGYIVTEAPPEQEVSEQAPNGERIFIYPKQGQSEQQQATDRYACHSWSTEQTGFDPTRPSGNVGENQYTNKRDDYYRAMKACLEARGYSVQ